MPFLAKNLIYRYSNYETREADDNAIKTVNLSVKSLSEYLTIIIRHICFEINQNYFNIPDKCITRLWWPLTEDNCQ